MNLIDYTNKCENEILNRAKESIGLTVQEICDKSGIEKKELNIRNKGNIGNLIEEYWFGIKNNNSPLPDFQDAKIELKIIPLAINKNKTMSVKERTKICSINYNELVNEKWDHSHARNKLQKVLFIYYLYDKENLTNSKIKKIELFKLQGNDEFIIKKDWNNVYTFVKEGNAHNLSERICNILAASRSGSGGKKPDGTKKDLVSQPNNNLDALKRAFSLKQSFTNQRWNELNKKRYESILELLNISSEIFEEEIIKKLNMLDGLTLGEIARNFDIKVPNGKNAAATIIKKAIGFKNVNSRIKEFEQLGIQVKIISTRKKDLKPFESVSFPTFKLKELVKENFYEGEDSDCCSLLNEIRKILFIPIFRDLNDDVKDRKIGKCFFWSPSREELLIIEEEWNKYIQEINNGNVRVEIIPTKNGYREVSKLSKESNTQIIHIRPHGKDRKDRDEDQYGNSIVKQSFWLNKKFLQKLLKKVYI